MKAEREVKRIRFDRPETNPRETFPCNPGEMFPCKSWKRTRWSCPALRFDIDFQDLFLRSENEENMVPEGMESEDLCKIHSGTETRKPRASPLKKNWTKFRVASVSSGSTMRSWLTMVCSMPRPFTLTSYSKQFHVQALQVVKGFNPTCSSSTKWSAARERERMCSG